MSIKTGAKLSQLRKQNGYSQEELAEKLSISRQAISKWERGESSPDTDTLIALAKLYGVSLDELVNYEPPVSDKYGDDVNEYRSKTDVPPACEYSDTVEKAAPFTERSEPQADEVPYKPINASPTPAHSGKGKKTFIIILSVVLAAAVCALIAFGISAAVGSREGVTDAEGENIRGGFGTAEMSVRETDGTVRTIKTDKSLLSPEAILTEYTEIMNELKTKSPAFTKIRYQNLPTDEQSLGAIGKIVLPIIERYVTSKSAANPVEYQQGNSDKLPVCGSPYGCLLTDVTKIKNSYCEILDDGTYKLVITLVDEMNPEILPAGATSSQSAVSSVFDPYEAIEDITSISEIAMHDINFNYTDCTVTLIYDKKTKNVISVNMVNDIKITINTLVASLNAEIIDITEYYDFH